MVKSRITTRRKATRAKYSKSRRKYKTKHKSGRKRKTRREKRRKLTGDSHQVQDNPMKNRMKRSLTGGASMETNPISLRNAELRLNFAIGCFSPLGSILSSLPEELIKKIQGQISAISFGDWLSKGEYSDYWEEYRYPLPCFEEYLHIPATDFRKSVNHYGLEYLFTYWDNRSGVNRILVDYRSDLKAETHWGKRCRDLLQKSENAKKELLIRLHEELKFPLSEEQKSRVPGFKPSESAPPHPYTFGEWLKMNDSPCGDGPNGEPCAKETTTIHAHPHRQPALTGKQFSPVMVVRNRSLLHGNDVLQRIFQDLLNKSIDEIKTHQGTDSIDTILSSHLKTGDINMDLSRKFRTRFNNEIRPENPLPVKMIEWLLNEEALNQEGIKCGSILNEFQHAFEKYGYLDYTTSEFRKEVGAETLQKMLDTGFRGGKIRGPVVKKFLWRLHNELKFPLSKPQRKRAGIKN